VKNHCFPGLSLNTTWLSSGWVITGMFWGYKNRRLYGFISHIFGFVKKKGPR